MMSRLVCGVGINDVPGASTTKFYRTWHDMLRRCYDPKHQTRFPTYIGCTVCPDWLIFSNFKEWMQSQDWQGKCLDKDIIMQGNKVYSPATCILVSQHVNKLLTCFQRTSNLPGSYFSVGKNKYESQIRINNKSKTLGYYDTELESHRAWQLAKSARLKEVANTEDDERLKNALIRWANKILEDHKNGVPTLGA